MVRFDHGMPFSEIVGHRALLTLVSRAIARDLLPPSLLISGPDGVGKSLVVRAIAQAMNCQTPRIGDDSETLAIDGCGNCSVCSRIERGIFPDVLSVEPNDNNEIRAPDVRPVLDQSSYRLFEGRRRIVVIDQAELMNDFAQSSLLKTLEEPPSTTEFVLVTTRPDMLLDTVRSRCSQLRFGYLTADDIVAVLVQRHDVDERIARPAAVTSGGSAGRALIAASGELATSRGVALELLDEVSTTRDARGRLEGAKVFTPGKQSRQAPAAVRKELRFRLMALTSLLRDIEVIIARARVPLANADLEQPLKRLAGAFADGRSRRALSAIDEAIDAIDRNASPKVVADWIACQL